MRNRGFDLSARGIGLFRVPTKERDLVAALLELAQVVDARAPSVTVARGRAGDFPDYLVVNAVDRAGIESQAARFVVDNPSR